MKRGAGGWISQLAKNLWRREAPIQKDFFRFDFFPHPTLPRVLYAPNGGVCAAGEGAGGRQPLLARGAAFGAVGGAACRHVPSRSLAQLSRLLYEGAVRPHPGSDPCAP